MRLAVLGANGRMGRAVVRLAHVAGDAIVCAVGAADHGRDVGELAGIGPIGVVVAPGVDALAAARAEVVVDFSAPVATADAARACAAAGIAFVSGTTGLDDAAKRALDEASATTAVLWEPNMSVGVHVLASLVAQALASLGAGYDVEVVETHHRAKIDAPSGTALRLGEVIRAARSGTGAAGAENATGARWVHGREGRPGPRDAAEIGMHALRGGDVVGDHTVFFFGDGERLELTHRASSRDLFAHGALRAARWLVRPRRAPGRYALADVLAANRAREIQV